MPAGDVPTGLKGRRLAETRLRLLAGILAAVFEELAELLLLRLLLSGTLLIGKDGGTAPLLLLGSNGRRYVVAILIQTRDRWRPHIAHESHRQGTPTPSALARSGRLYRLHSQ